MPTYEDALSRKAYKRLTEQYGAGGKRYGATASWWSIAKILYFDRRGYSLAKVFYKAKHPAQIHYGIWDKTTRTFEGSIRRATALSLQKAMPKYSNTAATIVNFGSGFGGMEIQLCKEYSNLSVTGISIDPFQVETARELTKLYGLSGRIRFDCANFLTYSTPTRKKYDAGIAIECLCHVPESQLTLLWKNIFNLLSSGGRFVVHDWYLNKPISHDDKSLEVFLKGWDMPVCVSVEQLISAAQKNGFKLIADRDITKLIMKSSKKIYFRAVLFRPIVLWAQGRDLPWLRSLYFTEPSTVDFVNTSLIQKKLFQSGVIKYCQLVFEKQ